MKVGIECTPADGERVVTLQDLDSFVDRAKRLGIAGNCALTAKLSLGGKVRSLRIEGMEFTDAS